MTEDNRVSGTSTPNNGESVDKSAPWRNRKHELPRTQAGKLWEAFGNPSEPVNEFAGGTYNSAGGKPQELTWKAAFDFNISDLKRFYKVPCGRDAFLVGLGGGAAVGGVTVIIGGKMGSNPRTRLTWLTVGTRSQSHEAGGKLRRSRICSHVDGSVRMVRIEKERGGERNGIGSDRHEEIAREEAAGEGSGRGEGSRCCSRS